MTREVLLSLVIPCVLMGFVKRFKKEVIIIIIIISSEFFFIEINLQDLIIICVLRCFLFSTYDLRNFRYESLIYFNREEEKMEVSSRNRGKKEVL